MSARSAYWCALGQPVARLIPSRYLPTKDPNQLLNNWVRSAQIKIELETMELGACPQFRARKS